METPAQNRDCASDNRGLRTGVAYSGVAFGSPAPPIGQSFGYNARAELTSSARDVMSWNYQYDPIGNRRQHTADPNPGDPATTDYIANNLNQYRFLDVVGVPDLTPGRAYDADGNLIREFGFTVGDANCDGVVDFFDIDAFVAKLGQSCAGWTDPCPCSNYDANGNGVINYYDIDAFILLLGAEGVGREYAWDAENRLIRVGPKHDDAVREVS